MGECTISQLQMNVDKHWKKTGLGSSVTIQTQPWGDATPHVEIVNGQYDIVIEERGKEFSREKGLPLLEASRWFLHGMAVGYAQDKELRGRQKPKDAPLVHGTLEDDGYSRWNWMAPTIEIMNKISPEFGEWARKKYNSVLLEFPLEKYEIRNARWSLKLNLR